MWAPSAWSTSKWNKCITFNWPEILVTTRRVNGYYDLRPSFFWFVCFLCCRSRSKTSSTRGVKTSKKIQVHWRRFFPIYCSWPCWVLLRFFSTWLHWDKDFLQFAAALQVFAVKKHREWYSRKLGSKMEQLRFELVTQFLLITFANNISWLMTESINYSY